MNKVNKVGAFVEFFLMIFSGLYSLGLFVQSIIELNNCNYFYALAFLSSSFLCVLLSLGFYVGWKNIADQNKKILDEERKLHED